LSLYGDRPQAFDAKDLAVAQVLAGHLAVSMAAGREIDQRGVAFASRTIIGQAEAILMERFDLDADQAFDYLRRVSCDANRKLAVVAEDLVRTPGLRQRVRPQAAGGSPGRAPSGRSAAG